MRIIDLMTLLKLNSFNSKLIGAITIPIFILIIYGQSIQFDYNIDDEYYLKMMPSEGSTFKSKLASINQLFNDSDFRPITYTTLLVESSLFSRSAKVFHTFNLIYFTLLCLTILYVFKNLYQQAGVELSFFLALLAALFFVIHPTHANVVASIKNRESILSLMFALWSLQFWINFRQSKSYRSILNFIFSATFLLIAIMSKRDAITFLLIIPVTYSFIQNNRSAVSFKKVAVFLLFVFIIMYGRSLINGIPDYHQDLASNVSYDENPLDFTKGLMHRWPAVVHVAYIYEKFMLWPKGYYFYFGTDTIPLWTYKSIRFYFMLIAHLLAVALVAFNVYKKRIQVLGIAFFFIAIFPFLNIIQNVAGIVAVRYSFIASLGFCLMLSQLFISIYQKTKKPKLKYIPIGLSLLFIVVYGFFSWQRTQAWENKTTLFNTDLPNLKRSVVANRMACTYYMDKYVNDDSWKSTELLQNIIIYADRALLVYDRETHVLQTKAKALSFLGRDEEAHELFHRAVEIDSTEIRGLSLLASHAKHLGKTAESIAVYERILDIDSSQLKPYFELSLLYAMNGEYEKARSINNQQFTLNNLSAAQMNLGNIEVIYGDTLKAAYHFLEVLKHDGISTHPKIYDMLEEYSLKKKNDSLKVELEKLMTN